MKVEPLPVRGSRSVCFRIDYDAEQLLRAMVPHGKGMGALIGELLRKEARERDQRAQLLQTLASGASREVIVG
jgi:hypothetical protein